MKQRIDAAVALRNRALELVKAQGVSKLVGDPARFAVRVREYTNCGLTIQHRPAGAPCYSERRSGMAGSFMADNHGLDIWTDKEKVLNMEWTNGGEVRLVSFRRGLWEKQLALLTS